MTSAIALNLRKKLKTLRAEAAYASPMGRCIVLEEEAFEKGRNVLGSYSITATYRKEPYRQRPLAFVAVEKKGFVGFGYYNVVDNSHNCWDDVVGCALTQPEAESKAFNRALKIAHWFSKMTGMPLINHTSRGGQMDIPIEELVVRIARLAARSRS